ncbi:hypothetical protein FRB96_003402 [Tulasnella sp. 330]|nr:hypothetical protein FRB96_003402 [Tulasnella sp. 330]
MSQVPSTTRIQPPSATRSSGLRKPMSSSTLRSSTTTNVKPPTTKTTTGTIPGTSTNVSALGTSTSASSASRSKPSAPQPNSLTKSPQKRPPPTLHTTKSSSSLRPPPESTGLPTTPTGPSKRLFSSKAGGGTASKLRAPLKSPTRPQQLLPEPRSESPPKNSNLSLKEQIALKRAQAKKLLASPKRRPSQNDEAGTEDGETAVDDDEWTAGVRKRAEVEEEDLLGRPNVKQVVERARESGNLNLTSRDLLHLPTCLFSMHLNVTPEPLPGAASDPPDWNTPSRHLAYYEIVDLTTIKAPLNSIAQLQPEISLFGGLRHLDLHDNKLHALPDTFNELACLVTLDLTGNEFESWPTCVNALQGLERLDLGRNRLRELIFAGEQQHRDTSTSIMPSLKSLNLSHNSMTASSILPSVTSLPTKLTILDLSFNPLGSAEDLIVVLGRSSCGSSLVELGMRKTELEANTFPPKVDGDVNTTSPIFAALKKWDLSENAWIEEPSLREWLNALSVGSKETIFVNPGKAGSLTSAAATALTIQIGKPDTRELWEIEAEERAQRLKDQMAAAKKGNEDDGGELPGLGGSRKPPVFAGGRRRMNPPPPVASSEVAEEKDDAWSDDLHTEAGRLRKRLADAEAAAETSSSSNSTNGASSASVPKQTPLDKYFIAASNTLTLPASKKTLAHNRHVSLTFAKSGSSSSDPSVPSESVPLGIIACHEWSTKLKVLKLSNRRADSSVSFLGMADCVSASMLRMERVDEVWLDGCGLGDSVRVKRSMADGVEDVKEELLLELLAQTFPALAMLNLDDNRMTTTKGVGGLFFPEGVAAHGRGLKVLRMQGNAINDVDGLVEVAERFGRGESDGWRGEEVDVRNNQIPKLPPVLGLLQLDVFLVEGNAFRVPSRTVWQREGTKGLLKYLRESVAQ